MTHKKLSELTPEKRKKALNFLMRETLFSVKNYRLTLKDWQKFVEALNKLEKYDFNCEELREALLNVEVATRTVEEEETLLNLKDALKPNLEPKLKKVPNQTI